MTIALPRSKKHEQATETVDVGNISLFQSQESSQGSSLSATSRETSEIKCSEYCCNN